MKFLVLIMKKILLPYMFSLKIYHCTGNKQTKKTIHQKSWRLYSFVKVKLKYPGIPCFIALHKCCVFYILKARSSTGKNLTIHFIAILYMVWKQISNIFELCWYLCSHSHEKTESRVCNYIHFLVPL